MCVSWGVHAGELSVLAGVRPLFRPAAQTERMSCLLCCLHSLGTSWCENLGRVKTLTLRSAVHTGGVSRHDWQVFRLQVGGCWRCKRWRDGWAALPCQLAVMAGGCKVLACFHSFTDSNHAGWQGVYVDTSARALDAKSQHAAMSMRHMAVDTSQVSVMAGHHA